MHSTCYEKGCQKRGDSRCGTFDGDQCAMRIDQIEKMAVDAADEALGSLLSDDQEGTMKTEDYKVSRWFNIETLKESYGVKVKVGGKWYSVGVDGVLSTFDTKEGAREKIAELKAETSLKELANA